MTALALPIRWRFGWLFAAPHRLAFGAGALMLATSALWWATAMLAQSGGHPMHFGLPPFQSHGLVMTLGFMPLFFTGFLFTAGPNWLWRPPVAAVALAPPLLAQLVGWAVFMLGVHGPDPAFGAVFGGIGLAAVAFGWTQVWWRFVGMLRASRVADRSHARVVAVAGAIGALSLWVAAAAVASSSFAWVHVALYATLWLFIGVTFAAVAHRMIPFFSAAALPVLDAWRPLWLLGALVGLFGIEGGFAIAEAWLGALPASWRAVQAAIELPAGLALLALAIRWGLVQSLRIRLLAMLHLGFVWLGLAFVLAGISHALAAASDGSVSLGVAPLHAYTMGFLGTTLIAMVARVSSGHGGRTLTADDVVWQLFWLLQVAVLVRVIAAVLAAAGADGAMFLIAVAAVGWCAVCGAWALRYAHWYGTPRSDGRPG